MSALRESVLLEMRLRGFAAKTVEAYIHALEQLWAFYRRALERLSCAEVQRFLDEVITVRKLAWATVNVYFSAYRFLYEQVLHRENQCSVTGVQEQPLVRGHLHAGEHRTQRRVIQPALCSGGSERLGGIRLEDDILITSEGSRFTGEKRIPITIEEVETIMNE